MGKNTWEQLDPDIAAMGLRAPRNINWGRIVLGLVIVSCGTFVAAYYLPLFRAHQALIDEFTDATTKIQSMQTSLGETQAKLEDAKGERDALKAADSARDARLKEQAARAEALKAKLEGELGADAQKDRALARVVEGHVEVALSARLLFPPHNLSVNAKAGSLLCRLAKAAPALSFVRAGGSSKERPNFMLKAKYSDPWSLGAGRAAAVVGHLEDKCQAKLNKATLGVAIDSPNAGEVSTPNVTLVVEPAASP
jgi:chemotaxis protein MotB